MGLSYIKWIVQPHGRLSAGEEIVLSGNLRITGRSDLTKITSAPQSRHFTIRAGTTLTLRLLNLTGGFRGVDNLKPTTDIHRGGSIFIENSGTLKTFVCLFVVNKGSFGGSISTADDGSYATIVYKYIHRVGKYKYIKVLCICTWGCDLSERWYFENVKWKH